MTELNKLTIAEARDALRKGDVTSLELTEACLTEIEGAGALNAFVHHTPERARDQARAADARLAQGAAPDGTLLAGAGLGDVQRDRQPLIRGPAFASGHQQRARSAFDQSRDRAGPHRIGRVQLVTVH